MTTHAYTHARNNLACFMKQTDDNREPVLISRTGKPPVVLLSLEEYEDTIVNKLLSVQGNPTDIGGSFHPCDTKASTAMRPS